MSEMVMASKYELEVKVKGSTAYQKDGQKTKIHGNKLIPRWFVESRNSQENNELYVIDEDATLEAMEQREQSIIDNAEKAKRDNVSMNDLVNAIASNVAEKKTKTKSKKAEKAVEEVEDVEDDGKLEATRAEYLDVFGKKPSHLMKLETLTAKIKEELNK